MLEGNRCGQPSLETGICGGVEAVALNRFHYLSVTYKFEAAIWANGATSLGQEQERLLKESERACRKD